MTTADRPKMYSDKKKEREREREFLEIAPLLSSSPEEQVRWFVGSFVGSAVPD